MVGRVGMGVFVLALGGGRAASAQATATIQVSAHVVDPTPSARAVSVGLRMTGHPTIRPARRDIPGATIFLDTLRTDTTGTSRRRVTIVHW